MLFVGNLLLICCFLHKRVLFFSCSIETFLTVLLYFCRSLRCPCVADTLQATLQFPLSTASLLCCLLTWRTPLSPLRPPTSRNSSTTKTIHASAVIPPHPCLGASAEPSLLAPCLPSRGQVMYIYFFQFELTEKRFKNVTLAHFSLSFGITRRWVVSYYSLHCHILAV